MPFFAIMRYNKNIQKNHILRKENAKMFEQIKPKETTPTYYFFSREYANVLNYVLKKENISNTQVYTGEKMNHYAFVHKITVPQVPAYIKRGPMEPATAVFISYYKLSDLEKVMPDLYSSDIAYEFAQKESDRIEKEQKDMCI